MQTMGFAGMSDSLLQLLVLLAVFPRTSGDGDGVRPRVLILGGGLTGLRVGQVLHQQGIDDFLILEADSKLGGRFLSYCIPGVTGTCVSQIHVEPSMPSPHPISDLLDKCSIAHAAEALATIKAVDDEGNDVSAELNETFNRLYRVAYNLIRKWKPEEDDMDLQGALRLYGWHPQTPVELSVDVFYSNSPFSVKPSELSTHTYVAGLSAAIAPDTHGGTHIYTIRNSYDGNRDIVDCLKNSFLHKSDERVKLNAKVTRIQYSTSGVTVTTADGRNYEADYAIVTFSLGVLQQEVVTFAPSLNYSKRKAINKFRMGYSTEVYSTFPTKIDGSIARSNQEPGWYFNVSPRRNVYHYFYEAFETIEATANHSQPHNLFVTWTTADDALRIETQDLNKTHRETTEVFRRFFGDSIPEPTVFVTKANTNPFYYGANPSFPSGATYKDYNKLREPLGERVFFAGDAYYMTTSWNGITRAFYSANETAMTLIECMKGGSCAMSKFAATQKCPTDTTPGNGHSVVSSVLTIAMFTIAYAFM